MHNILGAILAGGRSLRMGLPDKFLLLHQGQSLLQRVIHLAQPQVESLVINANGDPRRLTEFQLPVVPDIWADHQGPVAGIISVMAWAQNACQNAPWLVTFAGDTPYFPSDCVATLHQLAKQANLDVVYATSCGRSHYTFALWSMALLPVLQQRFSEGERSLHRLIQSCNSDSVDFSSNPEWFVNLNSPADWALFNAR